jgi:hypothetical protein
LAAQIEHWEHYNSFHSASLISTITVASLKVVTVGNSIDDGNQINFSKITPHDFSRGKNTT